MADRPADPDPGSFVEITAYDHATDVPGVALIGATRRVLEPAGITEIHESPDVGLHGVAWSCHFKAGYVHRARLRLKPMGRTDFRLEVHGSVTRYQRCFCDIDLAAMRARPAEEMTAATIQAAADDGVYEIECEFVPQFSTTHWFYLISRADELLEMPGCEGAAFEVGRFELAAATSLVPSFRLHHYAALELPEGVTFALQSLMILRNYFHLEFEIDIAGRQPVSVKLSASRPIGHAVWMWQLGSLLAAARRGDDTVPAASQSAAPDRGSVRLTPMANGQALPSPALFDRFGPALAYHGHAIWGIFDGWTDIQSETLEVSAKISEFVLEFTCDDGSRVTVVLDNSMACRLATAPQDPTDHVFWKMIEARSGGRFLEVGGRGPRAAIVRNRLSASWTYTGFDVLPGENVDIVGDAHLLSNYVDRGSIDALYANQVLEHLLAPWKFIVEANRVLRPGGLLFLMTPFACPLHAEPWDFYRFSDHSWVALLNDMTGFEMVDRSHVAPMVMLPRILVAGGERMQYGAAFMMSAVIARKTTETSAEWSAYDPKLAFGLYPRER